MGEDKEAVSLALVLLGIRLWTWCYPGAAEIQAGGKARWLLLLSRCISDPPPSPALGCPLAM